MVHTVEIDLHGRKITLETGKVAKQASGAVVTTQGETMDELLANLREAIEGYSATA